MTTAWPTGSRASCFFFWDNHGWGELGCYGGGVLRGAPTPRIDALAGDGLQLLNYLLEREVADEVLGGSRSRGPGAPLPQLLRAS